MACTRERREQLCQFRYDHALWTIELVFRGESYGWEAQFLKSGEVVTSRRFGVKAEATAWAQDERRAIESRT